MSNNQTPNNNNGTTIITDNGTVIHNSVGNITTGSGTQINIGIPADSGSDNKKKK